MRKRIWSWLVPMLAATGCLRGPAVTRHVDGRVIDEHWIPPEAYAAYMEGTLLEEGGDRPGAARAYERALDEDGSAEIWARLGGVRCLEDRRASDRAFQRARAKGDALGEVWVADAACALERGEAARARQSALRAASLSPERLDASLVVIAALSRTGETGSALHWLRAARLSFPEAQPFAGPPEALFAGPMVQGLVPASLRAALTGGANVERRPIASVVQARAEANLGELDAALARTDPTSARGAAVRAHVGLGFFALRAVQLGQPELARNAAEEVLAAEPTNVDARVAVLAAADLARDDESLKKWATSLGKAHDAPSAAAVRVMMELLARRVGPSAARVFVEAASGGPR